MSITSVLRSCFSCCYPKISVVPSTDLHDDPQSSSSAFDAEMANPPSLQFPAAPPPSPNRSSAAMSSTFTGPVFHPEPPSAEPTNESTVLVVTEPPEEEVDEDGFVTVEGDKKIN